MPLPGVFPAFLRFFQSRRLATSWIHSFIPQLVTLKRCGVTSPGSLAFRRRNSRGSMPADSASWSRLDFYGEGGLGVPVAPHAWTSVVGVTHFAS